MTNGSLHRRVRYSVIPERSAVLIEARSNVGPISFGTTSVSGYMEARHNQNAFLTHPAPEAALSLDLRTLQSGNKIYDAEVARRLDVRRSPTATIALRQISRLEAGNRYSLTGLVTLHGVTRLIDGAIEADFQSDGTCSISGEQVFDIRDFDIPNPTVLMLRIFPDVRVHMKLEMQSPDVTRSSN